MSLKLYKLSFDKAAAVDPVEGVAVAVRVAAGATHSKESFVLKVAPQLKLVQILLTEIFHLCDSGHKVLYLCIT